jgi:hypothetical protein
MTSDPTMRQCRRVLHGRVSRTSQPNKLFQAPCFPLELSDSLDNTLHCKVRALGQLTACSMQLDEALRQISDIRQQMARNEMFRGYRSITVGFSGALGLSAAAL